MEDALASRPSILCEISSPTASRSSESNTNLERPEDVTVRRPMPVRILPATEAERSIPCSG